MSVSHAPGSPTGISLRQILPQATFLNADDVAVESCAGNLGECQARDLFVALVGAEHDGHEDAVSAVQKGAAAVVGERLLPITSPQCIVEDSREAYGKICHALAGHPCSHLTTVGISGTDGKTTTAHLIHGILASAGIEAGLQSCLHNDCRGDSAANQPTPPALADRLARMVTAGNDAAVLESSSLALAQRLLAGTQLDVAVLTNLRGNHFHLHHTLANYQKTQLRLLDHLKPEGVAILNADDPATWFRLPKIDRPALTIGIRQEADITARILESSLFEQTFLLTAGAESVPVRTRIAGTHHIYNCLAATAAAIVQGIDLAAIARGLERVEELPGRMNLIRCGQDFPVAVDQASSPFRLGVALHTLKQHVKGRVICVYGGDTVMDNETASQFGRIAERSCDIPVLTGSQVLASQQQQPIEYEPFHRILDGFKCPSVAQLMPDRMKAIEWALSQAKPEDAVLIAGCGQQPIASLGEGRWSLTDTEVCQSWLYGETTSVNRVPVTARDSSIFHIDDYRPC